MHVRKAVNSSPALRCPPPRRIRAPPCSPTPTWTTPRCWRPSGRPAPPPRSTSPTARRRSARARCATWPFPQPWVHPPFTHGRQTPVGAAVPRPRRVVTPWETHRCICGSPRATKGPASCAKSQPKAAGSRRKQTQADASRRKPRTAAHRSLRSRGVHAWVSYHPQNTTMAVRTPAMAVAHLFLAHSASRLVTDNCICVLFMYSGNPERRRQSPGKPATRPA